MSLFSDLVALAKAAFPLPSFSDGSSNSEWLMRISPSLVPVIADFVRQLQLKSSVDIELPNGSVVTIYEDSSGKLAISREHVALLAAAGSDAMAIDWAALFEKLLPIILQILPLILNNDTDPVPAPTPTPDPVV